MNMFQCKYLLDAVWGLSTDDTLVIPPLVTFHAYGSRISLLKSHRFLVEARSYVFLWVRGWGAGRLIFATWSWKVTVLQWKWNQGWSHTTDAVFLILHWPMKLFWKLCFQDDSLLVSLTIFTTFPWISSWTLSGIPLPCWHKLACWWSAEVIIKKTGFPQTCCGKVVTMLITAIGYRAETCPGCL